MLFLFMRALTQGFFQTLTLRESGIAEREHPNGSQKHPKKDAFLVYAGTKQRTN